MGASSIFTPPLINKTRLDVNVDIKEFHNAPGESVPAADESSRAKGTLLK